VLVVEIILVNGRMVANMVKVHTLGQMVDSILVNGRMIRNMVKV
jgi:hypothetical protein